MYKSIKRFFDIFFAVCLLIGAWPFMLIAAIAIKVEDPAGPILFKQPRPGKDEKIFMIYKFRTMKVRTEDEMGNPLSDMARMTKVGKVLRKISLDEFPQFFNVLKGEMSFIGPRPLLVRYLPYYSEEQRKRHLVTPGISGWAQVNGRNTISWDEKFALDVWYAEHISFTLDLKIVMQTIKNVLSKKDINHSEGDTMPFFDEEKMVKDSENQISVAKDEEAEDRIIPKRLLILGAGGHGKVVMDLAEQIGIYEQISFLDDAHIGETILGKPVVGSIADFHKLKEEYSDAIVAIGNNEVRLRLTNELLSIGYHVPTFVHKKAFVSDYVHIDVGSIVLANAVVHTGARIGRGSIINTGAIVEHDNQIGDGVHLSPGAILGGTVRVGDCTWICIGATIKNNVCIATRCIIGAGAVVINDINEDGALYVGVPAKLKEKE